MIRGLVVTHGCVGEELLRATEMICGPQELLDSLSNQGQSVIDLTAAIQRWLTCETGAEDPAVLLFVDDHRGSCAVAAQLACARDPGPVILGGVNLAMLLEFASARDRLGLAELAESLIATGRAAIGAIDTEQGD